MNATESTTLEGERPRGAGQLAGACALVLALAWTGCSSTSAPRANTPMSADLRAGLGRIAIVQHAVPRGFVVDMPNPHVRREVLSGAIERTTGVVAGVGT